MELQQLRYVLAVAETGGFTRAAERCFVVQSALSHQIAALERELGLRLFARTSRRVRLTTAGEAFLPAARACLEAADRAVADAAAAVGEVRGRLTVGVIPTAAAIDIPAALRGYRRSHPRVGVELRMGGSDELVAGVRAGDIDAAVLGLPESHRPRGVRYRVIGRDHLVAVVGRDHALAGHERVDLARLSEETFADFPASSPGRAQSDEAFQAAGLRREVAFEAMAIDLLVRLVQQDLAIALLPSAAVPDVPGIAVTPVIDGPSRVEYLAWSDFNPSPAATAFLTLLDGPDGPDGAAGRPVED